MGNTKRRVFSGILALALCLSCLSLTAFAQSHEPKDEVIIYTGDPNAKPPASPQETKPPATDPPSTTATTPPATTPPATTPPATEPPATTEPGEPFSQGSDIVTRDMLYDKATNKQFITIQDRDGNYFYLVIDYDAPLNEDEEGYQVYFLNPVDAGDLGALVKTEATEPPVCICSQHCQAGAIRMDCPVCASNMAECAGSFPEPTTEPTVPETQPEPEKSSGAGGLLVVLLLVAGIGGVGWYFLKNKLPLPKTKGDTDLDDYDYGEDDPWENEDEPDGDGTEDREGGQP